MKEKLMKDIINKIGNWLEKVALERAYIERNGCPFAIGEDKLPEKLLELKRNVGNHYEDFDL